MMGEPSTYHAKLPCLLVELPVGEEKNDLGLGATRRRPDRAPSRTPSSG